MKKQVETPPNDLTTPPNDGGTLTAKQERFCELIAMGLAPQEAHLATGYSAKAALSNPYKLLSKPEIRDHIATLIDRALPRIVRNDIALARLRVHKGEGLDIPPSLIEGAKNRLYDRSSLGPVVRKVDTRNLNLNESPILTPEERVYYLKSLGYEEKEYRVIGERIVWVGESGEKEKRELGLPSPDVDPAGKRGAG